MLALEDQAWSQLADAYGSAAGVPTLLRAVKSDPTPAGDPRAEPWYSLWSRLCHQDDVFTASYAAVPHLVSIGLTATGPIDFSLLLLPACIEVARASGRGPAIPEHLSSDYQRAIIDLRDVIAVHRDEVWDVNTTQAALAALAVAHGQPRLAEVVTNLDSELTERILARDL